MSRIILFKGKRVDNGEWIEGYVGFSNDKKTGVIFTQDFDYDIHPETVCQFINRIDKNGKKIFEGDILNCSDYYDDEPYETTVRFKDGGFLVDVQRQDYDITCIAFLDDDTEVEIIGNIHD